MPHSHPTNPISTSPATPNPTPNSNPNHNRDQPLTPSLFDQIQSLFLLQNASLQHLYTQFKVSLSVLFSILHDRSTQSLRRAIDEHNYFCAQRAHLDLILETQNVAKQFALIENPTQEQRRRLGTLNNTLKISFANLQHLKADLLSQPDTTPNSNTNAHNTTSKPTHPKTTPQKTTRPIPTPSHTPPHTPSQHQQPAPTPTPTHPNTSDTTPNTTHTTTPNPTPYATFASDPRWHEIQPHLTPPATALAPRLAAHYQEVILMQPTQVAINTLNALALHPEFTTTHTTTHTTPHTTPHTTQPPQTSQPAHPHTTPNQPLQSASAP